METPSERIAQRVTSTVLVLAFLALAYKAVDMRDAVMLIVGSLMGQLTGATVANRAAAKAYERAAQGGSQMPPPNDQGGQGPYRSPSRPDVSEAPPPAGRRNRTFRLFDALRLSAGAWVSSALFAVWVFAAALVAVSACRDVGRAPEAPTARELAFVADVNACVDKAKAAGTGRAGYEQCRAATLAAYGIDAGPR